jgi:hypothetical protein
VRGLRNPFKNPPDVDEFPNEYDIRDVSTLEAPGIAAVHPTLPQDPIPDVGDKNAETLTEAQAYVLLRRFWMQTYFVATAATAGPLDLGFIPTDVWGFIENANFMSSIAGGTPEQIIHTDPNDSFSSQAFYTTSKRGTFQFGNDPGLMVAPGSRLYLSGTGLAAADVLRVRLQVALKSPVFHEIDPGFAEDANADILEALAGSE